MATQRSTGESDIVLYDHPGSPCSRRVKISMFEKGIGWTTQRVDLSRLEQRSARFLAINPNGLVPALAHGDRVLWESNVITEYLDRVYPQTPLYPMDADERAAVKRWQDAELAMARIFRPLMYQRLMGPLVQVSRTLAEAMEIARRSTADPADLAWEERVWNVAVLTRDEQAQAERDLLAFADKVESALDEGPWLVGGGFSQAEISIFPRLSMYELIGVALPETRFSRTRAWLVRLAERPSFLKTRSEEERKLRSIVTTPVFAFIRRVTATPQQERSPADRLGFWSLRQVMRRLQPGAVAQAGWRTPSQTPPVIAGVSPRPRATLSPAGVRLRGGEAEIDVATVKAAFAWRGLTAPLVEEGVFALERPGACNLGLVGALDVVDLLQGSGRRLFPDEPWAEARVRTWLAFDASLHKEFNVLAAAVRGEASPPGSPSVELATHTLNARLNQLEEHLEGRDWLVDVGPTFADLVICLRVIASGALGLPMRDLRPKLCGLRDRLARKFPTFITAEVR